MRIDLPVSRTACVRETGRFSGVSVLVAEEDRGFAGDFFGERGPVPEWWDRLSVPVQTFVLCRRFRPAGGGGTVCPSLTGSCAESVADGMSTGIFVREAWPMGRIVEYGWHSESGWRCRWATSCRTLRCDRGAMTPSAAILAAGEMSNGFVCAKKQPTGVASGFGWHSDGR